MRAMTLAVLFSVSIAASAFAQATPAAVHVMNGMFMDAKEPNKSACAGNCLNNWPVLKAEAADKDMGDWKVITRDDGSKQWAYKGKPLYYFAMDKAAGDKLGDGRGMVWHIAKP